MITPKKWLGKAIILFTVIFILGCEHNDDSNEASIVEVKQTIAVVKTIALTDLSYTPQWRLTGIVVARYQADLSFRVDGQITTRLVNVGDIVKPNQVLFKLDPTDYELSLNIISSNIRATRAEINHAKSELGRFKKLLTRNLTTQQNVDQASSQLIVLQERLKSQILQAKQAKNQLSYTVLKSPSLGKILEIKAEKGEVVRVGNPLISIAFSSYREVKVQVPEKRLADLPEQAVVQIYGTKQTFPVQLREIAGQADVASRTWTVFYELKTENNEQQQAIESLKLGQTATVIFSSDESFIRVPITALYEKGDYHSIWKVENEKVSRVQVKVVKLSEKWAWLEGDFTAITTIVSLGVNRLHEGQAIRKSTE